MKNQTFHIVYFKKADDIYSTGTNIEAEDMLQALIKFKAEYKVEPFFISLKSQAFKEPIIKPSLLEEKWNKILKEISRKTK